MTVQQTTNIVSYSGNGVTTAWAIPAKFLKNSDIFAVVTDSTGFATLLFGGQDFTLAGAGNDFGGTLVTTIPVASGSTIVITRLEPINQLTAFPTSGIFPAKAVETAFDKLTMIAQDLSTDIGALQQLTGSGPNQQLDVYQLNASVLLLRKTIQHSFEIPAGYNALAINPTFESSVTVTIPAGSEFVTLAPGQGGGSGPPLGGPTLTGPNIFTGVQYFGTQIGHIARIDPARGDFYIFRVDNTQANEISGEYNAFAADINQGVGASNVVPIHGHALSAATHFGDAYGGAFEAHAYTDKSGAGLASNFFGVKSSVVLESSLLTSAAHAGYYAFFANRQISAATPVNGLPSSGNAYNKRAAAFIIDALTRGSNTAIQCGWNVGIRFKAGSLDSAAGVLATGIDFTELDAIAPEGSNYGARIRSLIALPTDVPMSFSTDKISAQLSYRNFGALEIAVNGSMRVGFGMGNGTVYMWDGINADRYTYYFDGAGTQNSVFNVRSGARTFPPANTGLVVGWIRVAVDSVAYAMPLYQ